MATQHAGDEADIRQLIQTLIKAVRSMDLDLVKSVYASDVVTFDVAGPLQRAGIAAKTGNWAEAFEAFQPPLGYEIREITITSSGDVAFVHGFGRLSGTLKNGAKAGGFWVRFTACLRRTDGQWLIAHDHVSVPLDLASGSAVLTPELS